MTINTTTKSDLIKSRRFAKERSVYIPKMKAKATIEERSLSESIPKEGAAYYDQLEKELAA